MQNAWERFIVLVKLIDVYKRQEVRLGDGIRVLKPNEATFLTIAGMGGTTMVEILSAKPEVLASVKGMARCV